MSLKQTKETNIWNKGKLALFCSGLHFFVVNWSIEDSFVQRTSYTWLNSVTKIRIYSLHFKSNFSNDPNKILVLEKRESFRIL